MEPGGLWDADRMLVEAEVRHNDREVAQLVLGYAGRVNVFGGEFQLAEVAKDYEVLSIRVTASEPAALNLGAQTRTYKLTP